jgi:hypothetical protein
LAHRRSFSPLTRQKWDERQTPKCTSPRAALGHQLSLQRDRDESANLLIALPIEENQSLLGRAWGSGAGRTFPLCPGSSDVDLLCDGKGIIDLDAEVPYCAFDLGVIKQNLHGSQVAGAPVDQARLGSAKRVCTKRRGSRPILAIQAEASRAYCLVDRDRLCLRRPRNRNSRGILPAVLT